MIYHFTHTHKHSFSPAPFPHNIPQTPLNIKSNGKYSDNIVFFLVLTSLCVTGSGSDAGVMGDDETEEEHSGLMLLHNNYWFLIILHFIYTKHFFTFL